MVVSAEDEERPVGFGFIKRLSTVFGSIISYCFLSLFFALASFAHVRTVNLIKKRNEFITESKFQYGTRQYVL